MKKTLFIMLGAMLLILAGTVTMACSSDDDVTIPEVPETGLETRQLPKQTDFIRTVILSATLGITRGSLTYLRLRHMARSILMEELSIIYMICPKSIRRKARK